MKEISTNVIPTTEELMGFYDSLDTEGKIIMLAAVIGVKDWTNYPIPVEEKRELMINAARDYIKLWDVNRRDRGALADEVAAVMTHVLKEEPYTAESVFWAVNRKKMS